MPIQYKFQAISDDGRTEDGVLTAESTQQVLDHLAEQHLIPISVKAVKATAPFSFWGFFGGVPYEDLIMFTNNLCTLYKAGIPLLRALSIIKVGASGNRFNYAISQIRLSLQSGRQLSVAMSEFDDLFPRFYIASVAAGEESGKLDEILEELADMLERELELTRQIKSGIRYPTMVVLALIVAFIIMMTFVVPKFVEFFSAFNAELPITTRMLIATSDFLEAYWPVLVGLVIVGAFTFRKLSKHEKSRFAIDGALLKLPIIGGLIIKGNVARFSLMFRILIQSGLPIVKSLEILTGSVKNSVIAHEIVRLRILFAEGKDNRLTSEEFVCFPDLALQMISIGLESGSLERMLGEVGRHYSQEVHYTSSHLTSILEPILTVGMGGFVLILALSIFLPMWNLIKVFNG